MASDALRERLEGLALILETRVKVEMSADDSARPAYTLSIPTLEIAATIPALREAAAALSAHAGEAEVRACCCNTHGHGFCLECPQHGLRPAATQEARDDE